jgi:hypothetical protein
MWQAGKSTTTLKSRQVGFSLIALSFIGWKATFDTDFDILLLSSKEEKAIKLLKKLSFFLERLPDWMRSRTLADSKTQIVTSMRYYDESRNVWVNGEGTVSSLTTTGTTGAGESARVVLVDEFALMSERGNDEEVWAAVAPTTTHGGQLITGSTPRGSAGQFYYNWNGLVEDLMNDGAVHEQMPHAEWTKAAIKYAFNNDLDMIATKAHYSMGNHDEEWIQAACVGLSPRKARQIQEHFSQIVYDADWRAREAKKQNLSQAKEMQEYELIFDMPGAAAFSSEDITACYKSPKLFPYVNKLISSSGKFYIGVDTGEGITIRNQEPDYNSICVLNQSGVQVHAVNNRENLDDWAGRTEVDPVSGETREIKGTVLRTIESFLPCTVIVEKNGPGMTVINRIDPHLPYEAEMHALSMSSAVKPQLVSDLVLELSDEQIIIRGGERFTFRRIIITDFFTSLCMRQYIKVGPGKFQANVGFFDDPVVSLMWASYARRLDGAYNFLVGAAPSEDDIVKRAIGLTKAEDVDPREVFDPSQRVQVVYGPRAVSEETLAGMAAGQSAVGGGERSLSGGRRSLSSSRRRLHGR